MAETFASLEVIELCSGYGPAVVAGKLLADLGCRVTKIEPPGGDPLRNDPIDEGSHLSLFSLVCGSKDSACLDLGKPGSAAVLEAILSRADVLLLDAPAWRDVSRLIADRSAFPTRFPRLTVCVASYFGVSGPLAEWTGSEETVQALSGVMSTTGHRGEPPVRIPGAMLTHAAAMYAVISVLGDLMRKRQTGTASFLDCGAMLPAASFLTAAYPAYFLSGKAPSGIGNRHAMSAPWNTFPCSDGWLVICAGNEPSWRRLCTTIERPDLLSDPRFATAETRVENVDALEAEIAAWTQAHTVAEAERLVDSSGTPSGAIIPLHDVLGHPQFEQRSLLQPGQAGGLAGGVFHRDGKALPVSEGRSGLGEATWDLPGRFGVERTTLSRIAPPEPSAVLEDVA